MENNAMYSALDIATWFIYKTNAERKEIQAINDEYEIYEGLTHLKLQKLLYYAQGVALSVLDYPLFNEEIEAWDHGPVIKNVFHQFSFKGRNEITLEDSPSGVEVIRNIENDSKIREILNMVYDNFAIYTAWQLRNLTHQKGTPWYVTYISGKNMVISKKIIKDYFNKEIMD